MNRRILVLLAGIVPFTWGCSSAPSRVDRGAIEAGTFSFVSAPGRNTAAFADEREQMHALIQDAITRSLAGKGVSKVETGGDVTVAYLVVIGNNASTQSIDDYFGYGRDSSALLDKAQRAYSSSRSPNYFEAGTLLIDLVDTKSFQLLRRSHVTRPLLADASREVRAAHIQEAVDEALQDLRIAN